MLNDKQLAAIDLMVAGRPLHEIEEVVGISHTQFWRWRTDDNEFQVRLDQERARLHQERVEKLWLVGERAMDVALESLEEGDPTMARDILKLLAPGLVDVRYSNQGPPALGMAASQPQLPTDTTVRFRCDECGRECRSAAGLASHGRTHAT